MDAQKLKTLLGSLPAKHVMLVVGLFVAIMAVAFSVGKKADQWASDWAVPVVKANTERATADSKLAVPGTPGEQARLKTQLRDVRAWAEHHRVVTAFFYGRHYVAITMTSLTALFAAFLVGTIGIKGWQHASSYAVTALIVFGGAAAFFGAFPGVYQQEENITKNKALYLGYVGLENEMLSYFATYSDDPKKEQPPPDRYIHTVDEKLRGLNDMVVRFDRSAIPNYEAEIKKALTTAGKPEQSKSSRTEGAQGK